MMRRGDEATPPVLSAMASGDVSLTESEASSHCVAGLPAANSEQRQKQRGAEATDSDSPLSSSATGALCPNCDGAVSGSESFGGTAGASSRGSSGGGSPMLCYAMRLKPGEELKGALAAFVSDRGIRAGFIVSCVGSVRDVVLRLAGAERPSRPGTAASSSLLSDRDITSSTQQQQHQRQGQGQAEEERQPMLHTGPDARFEVLSLVGTLSPQGLHLHASLGDEEGAVCGGHLVSATVHTTAEIVVGEVPALSFSRAMDPATGFKELVVGAC